MSGVNRGHYTGDYDRRAALLRARAAADPATRCRRCGFLARPGDPWEAGHVRDGDPTSPLAPEHRSCNRRAGAVVANQRRIGLRTTR